MTLITKIGILGGIACLGFGAFSTMKNYMITIGSIQFSNSIVFIVAGIIMIFVSYKGTNNLNRPIGIKNVQSWHIFLICVLVLIGGIITGFLFRSVVTSPSVSFKPYEVFKDVLFANLAITSLMVAVLGALIYQIVKQRLYAETTLKTHRVKIGLSFYNIL